MLARSGSGIVACVDDRVAMVSQFGLSAALEGAASGDAGRRVERARRASWSNTCVQASSPRPSERGLVAHSCPVLAAAPLDHPAYARGRMGSGLAHNPIPAEGLGVPPSVELIESLGLDLVSLEWWAADKSTVVFVRITDRLSLAVSQGPGHRDSLPFYSDQAPKTCANPGSVIFFDVGRLSSTDLRVVSTLLSVGKANRHNLAEVHMLYTSPLVGMAVTVGNIALSGLIRLYHEAEPFHAALRSACQIRTTLVSPA